MLFALVIFGIESKNISKNRFLVFLKIEIFHCPFLESSRQNQFSINFFFRERGNIQRLFASYGHDRDFSNFGLDHPRRGGQLRIRKVVKSYTNLNSRSSGRKKNIVCFEYSAQNWRREPTRNFHSSALRALVLFESGKILLGRGPKRRRDQASRPGRSAAYAPRYVCSSSSSSTTSRISVNWQQQQLLVISLQRLCRICRQRLAITASSVPIEMASMLSKKKVLSWFQYELVPLIVCVRHHKLSRSSVDHDMAPCQICRSVSQYLVSFSIEYILNSLFSRLTT